MNEPKPNTLNGSESSNAMSGDSNKGRAKLDIRQNITDRIISMLENGRIEGKQSWLKAASRGVPRNGKSGSHYSGVNVFLLWSEAVEKKYASNVWLTFNQAVELGACVRKGEKGVMCVFFEMSKIKSKNNSEDKKEKEEFYPMCKPFWLFNIAQIDGLPFIFHEDDSSVNQEINKIDDVDQLVEASGATIRHGYTGAFYAPDQDAICMPNREKFTTAEGYYATVLHEMTHWTGHEKRLNRSYGKRFGDAAYAFEELVAELGAAFIVGHFGLIDATIEGHVCYLDSWLQVLRNDKTAIFTAAKHANQAFDFLMSKCGVESMTVETA